MKRPFISVVAFFLFSGVMSQNIGIGITTPRAKLHVFQGASGNQFPYPPLAVENNGHTYVNLLSPDANERGILFGNSTDATRGAIIYNNSNTFDGFQFRTLGNQNRMVITSNGNVGIGTLNPSAALGFSTQLGKKITLFPSGPGDYGFGIQPNVLQVYTDNSNSDIAFGYDQGGGNLAEKFRFKGTGAFVVNGNAGNAGQVLQTNGNGASPTWTTPTNLLYNNTISVTNNIATLINGSSITVPLGHTFATTTNVKVLMTFSFPILAPSCFACGNTGLWIYLYLNGNYNRAFRIDVLNDVEQLFSGTALISVGPGTHTISFLASRIGPDVYVGHSGRTITAIYQIIPQ